MPASTRAADEKGGVFTSPRSHTSGLSRRPWYMVCQNGHSRKPLSSVPCSEGQRGAVFTERDAVRGVRRQIGEGSKHFLRREPGEGAKNAEFSSWVSYSRKLFTIRVMP